MSIKSTKTLTRLEAENLYKHFRIEKINIETRIKLNTELICMDDEELGNKLDEISTDSFSNYLVED